MGVKISELTEAMAAQNTDLLPIVQNGETKKIQVETLLTNIQTQITNLQTQINTKNIITAGLSSNITLSTTGENNLMLNTAKTIIGTNLTLSNGAVVIGPGVSMVLISAMVYTSRSSSAGGACNVLIKKNGVSAAQSINTVPSGAGNHSTAIPPVLITVEEGDLITLDCYGYSGDIISSSVGTHLTVQVIN